MELSDKDVVALREYLQKGGFIIFDDFRAQDWYNFSENMRRVLPNEELVQLDVTHPIFHSFFDIQTLEFQQAYDRGGPAQFWGMFPKNDRSKPLRIDRQLQQRRVAVLAVVRHRFRADPALERSLQARCELRHLRDDALTTRGRGATCRSSCFRTPSA